MDSPHSRDLQRFLIDDRERSKLSSHWFRIDEHRKLLVSVSILSDKSTEMLGPLSVLEEHDQEKVKSTEVQYTDEDHSPYY